MLVVGSALLGACGGGSSGAPPDYVPLKTPDGSLYTANVTIGTQVFEMDLDTGSTTVGVAGSSCTSCGVTPEYAPSASATDEEHTASTEYGDNSKWSGEIFSDKMTLSHGTPSVAVQFASMTSQSAFFDGENDYQGIIGLGPAELLETDTTAYMTAAAAAGSPQQLVFELCPTDGKMWVGDYDTNDQASDPVYTPLLAINGTTNPFYAVEVDDLALDGTSLGFGSADFKNPIVDTGTSLFYAPSDVVSALITKVNASAGRATVFGTSTLSTGSNGGAGGPCGGLPYLSASTATSAMVDASLPKMSVALADGKGGKVTIEANPTESYLADLGGGVFCLLISDDQGEGGVLGDAFLQAYITVIDPVNKRVGFASENGCTTTTAREEIEGVAAAPRAFAGERGHPHRRAVALR